MTDVVLLDFDGVISPYTKDLDSPPDHNPWGDSIQGPDRLFYSPSLIAALVALPAELIWLTTRGTQAADELAGPMGFPSMRSCPRRDSDGWYKLDWAMETAQAHRVAWFDDEAFDWRCPNPPKNLHIVQPDRTAGISPAEIESVRRFFRGT